MADIAYRIHYSCNAKPFSGEVQTVDITEKQIAQFHIATLGLPLYNEGTEDAPVFEVPITGMEAQQATYTIPINKFELIERLGPVAE